MFISQCVMSVRNTHFQVKTILVFPVKAPQLLSDIQHMLQAHCLFEIVTGTSVLTYGKCLCACVESPVAGWGQRSDGVPLALAGWNPAALMSFLCDSRDWAEVQGHHRDMLKPYHQVIAHSQTGAGVMTRLYPDDVTEGRILRSHFLTGTFDLFLQTNSQHWHTCLWFL